MRVIGGSLFILVSHCTFRLAGLVEDSAGAFALLLTAATAMTQPSLTQGAAVTVRFGPLPLDDSSSLASGGWRTSGVVQRGGGTRGLYERKMEAKGCGFAPPPPSHALPPR